MTAVKNRDSKLVQDEAAMNALKKKAAFGGKLTGEEHRRLAEHHAKKHKELEDPYDGFGFNLD